jgi:hypothetical protein
MKCAVVVLAGVCACDAGQKKPATRDDHRDVVVAVPASADASAVDAPTPCSPADLGATGEQQAPRLVAHENCRPRWEHIGDVASMAQLARSGIKDSQGQPLLPPPQRVVGIDAGPAAIEVMSAGELASFVTCKPAVRVDWKRDRVWLVAFGAENGFLSIESVIDDGHTATLGVLAGRAKSCGDAAPPENQLLELVLVPRGRDVRLAECTDNRPDPCPNYDGKGG